MWAHDGEKCIMYPHEDALVINANVVSKEFNRILIDTGSSVDMLFQYILEEMGIAYLRLKHTNTSLKGSRGGKLTPKRIIELSVIIVLRPFEKIMMLDLVTIEENSSY